MPKKVVIHQFSKAFQEAVKQKTNGKFSYSKLEYTIIAGRFYRCQTNISATGYNHTMEVTFTKPTLEELEKRILSFFIQ